MNKRGEAPKGLHPEPCDLCGERNWVIWDDDRVGGVGYVWLKCFTEVTDQESPSLTHPCGEFRGLYVDDPKDNLEYDVYR